MTIKEIEELTGMPRANIRFYEAEGLITPARSANGYRDYSTQDADILKKIKLLRSLHISLEEIKALHAGSQNLSDTLEQHIIRLSAQKEELDNAQKICGYIKQDGVTYQNLNPEKYLNAFSNLTDASPQELSQDTIPPVRAPWRRFFARTLDEVLYSFIWNMILILVFRVNIANMGTGGNILDFAVCLILTVFLEPLQLSLFGTTLGKSILGLSVRDNNDRKLTYNEALSRTCQVLLHGCGLNFPLFNLYRNWKSYNTCITYNTLPWEYESTLILKDEKPWRTAIYIVVRVFFLGALVLAGLFIQSPPIRGELTVEEFCHNYNYLEKYYDIDGGKELNARGKWQERRQQGSGYTIYIDNLLTIEEKQNFQFDTDSKGHIQSLEFTLEYTASAEEEDRPAWLPDCRNQMILSALAFIGAQEDFNIFSNHRQKIVEQISTHGFQDFQFTLADVTVTCDFESQGLTASPSSNMIFLNENADIYYYLHFSMEK